MSIQKYFGQIAEYFSRCALPYTSNLKKKKRVILLKMDIPHFAINRFSWKVLLKVVTQNVDVDVTQANFTFYLRP